MRKQFTSASCPACGTLFERLPVEYDEDSGYAFLEVHPCAGCGKMLCARCDQFHCDGCGQTFCADHLVSVPDGTDGPLHCCEACAAECEPLELPARIPPQSQVLARPHLEAARDDVRTVPRVHHIPSCSNLQRSRSLAHALLEQSG